MLRDLDQTLTQLLHRELPSSLPDSFTDIKSISFATPSESETPKADRINFFLYDVRENVELRSSVGVMGRQENGMITKIPPPVFVDCSYLITVWLQDSSEDPPQEHWILGEVMTVLLRYPKIPARFFQGSLVNQDQPIRATALRPGQLQNLGEFWQAIGGKPKATLHYTVTLAVPVHDPVNIGKPVTDKIIGIKTGADIPTDRLQPLDPTRTT
jgi:Pvc16 N-terminal domain